MWHIEEVFIEMAWNSRADGETPVRANGFQI